MSPVLSWINIFLNISNTQVLFLFTDKIMALLRINSAFERFGVKGVTDDDLYAFGARKALDDDFFLKNGKDDDMMFYFLRW